MTLRFDFGVEGITEEGYTKVLAGDAYHSDKGYGFVRGTQVTSCKREEERLVGDFCIPFDASFIVDVEDGNYIVTMHMGDALAPACTTLKRMEKDSSYEISVRLRDNMPEKCLQSM